MNACYYIKFIQLHIIKPTRNYWTPLQLYTYVLELISHMCKKFTHTLKINNTETFVWHPVSCERKYCMKKTITIYRSKNKLGFTPITHFYILIKLNIKRHFCASLLTALENIVQNETVTIYTTTYTHASHIIIHLYTWKHFHTILNRFKNRFHQVVSLSFLIELE